MASERDRALTHRWLVPILLGIIGVLVGAWGKWITYDHLRIASIADRLERDAADHESRLRELERGVGVPLGGGGGRAPRDGRVPGGGG